MKDSTQVFVCWFVLPLLRLAQSHSHFTCEPITIHRCEGLPYNMTFFPNKLDHFDQDMAAVAMEPFLPLMNLRCSPNVKTFLCSAFVPACMEDLQIIPPCRKLCEEVLQDCEKLIETFGIAWPDGLQCDQLEDCVDGQQSSAVTPTSRSITEKTSQTIVKDYGFWCPRPLKTPTGHGSSFLGVDDCLPPCPNMYFKEDELSFAKCFIGVVSIFCLCATLFTFLTFLIDVRRFRYPERPIIFYAVETLIRPDLSLFMMKYLMTLIVGIPAVFWVGSRKTCSEWANFFHSAHKRDPITESRRVLQESCEFFLKHNSKVQHKKKHKSSSHKLRVISKSMGTSTTGMANHGTSTLPATNHESFGEATFSEAKPFLEISEHDAFLPAIATALNASTGEQVSLSLSGHGVTTDLPEKRSKGGSVSGRVSNQSEGLQRVPDGRLTPRDDYAEEQTVQSSFVLVPHNPRASSSKSPASLLVHALPDITKFEDSENGD
ncbi:frizzled-6-like isoform X3 [Chiloscyllium punctatum]|uniref:frizzled-6-like isoform X3 n=1 Tax=Chiloscyllium punctatum TaxID=137246 RepID=UPI003B63246E